MIVYMTIEQQTIEIPVSENSPRTTAEALHIAALKAADPNRKPLSRYFGIHKGIFGSDGTAYQRKLRDEWD